jgi:type IV secretory pathway TrbL component
MHKFVFLFALLLAPQAQSATARCGTDAFGNAVCMDKDGVVTAAPAKRAGAEAKSSAASAVSAGEAGKTRHDEQAQGVRCGVDPFGNTVCANISIRSKE